MFVLVLNDMRSAHAEDSQPVARAETREELVAFMERETAPEPYGWSGPNAHSPDYTHTKTFRPGPLEWFNPPTHPGHGVQDVGTREEWSERAGLSFDEQILSVVPL